MKRVLLILVLGLASCFGSFAQSQAEALEEVISSRRSIRKYTEQKVDRTILDRIVHNGLLAPSGMNRQSYEIRIVDNQELLEAISRSVSPLKKSIFFSAAAVIFIAYDESYGLSQIDCGLLAQNMMLSAKSLGLGTCCMGAPIRQMLSSKDSAPYIEKLGFSKGFNLILAIAVGYPAEDPSPKARKDTMVKYVE